MATPPKKKPGLSVGIMVGVPKKSAPQDLDSPDPVDSPMQGGGGDPEDNNQEPAGDQDVECKADPEAVGFRSVHESCQFCKYMQGEDCIHPMVAQPVQPGDSCGAFEGKNGEDQMIDDQDQSAEPTGEQS